MTVADEISNIKTERYTITTFINDLLQQRSMLQDCLASLELPSGGTPDGVHSPAPESTLAPAPQLTPPF